MALEGADNQGPPPPPPPPPAGGPPPPPPPPGGGIGMVPGVKLTPEQDEQLATLRVEIAALVEKSEAGDQNAADALKKLKKAHEDELSAVQRKHVAPFNAQITDANAKQEKLLEGIKNELEQLEQQRGVIQTQYNNIIHAAKANPKRQKQAEILLENKPGKPLSQMIADIDGSIYELEQRKIKSIADHEANIKALNQKVNEGKKIVAPYKVFVAAFPVAKKKQAEEAKPRQAIDLNLWLQNKMLDDIDLGMLRKFITRQGDDASELSDDAVIRRFHMFMKDNPEFDERTIFAITSGFLVKDFHENDKKPLQGTRMDPENKALYEELLSNFYVQNPVFKDTAKTTVDVNANNGLAEVVNFVQKQQMLGNKPAASKPASDGKQEVGPASLPTAPKQLKPTNVNGKEEAKQVSDTQQKRQNAVEEIEQKVQAKSAKALKENPTNPTKRGADKNAELAVQLFDDIVDQGKTGPLQALGLKELQLQLGKGELSPTALSALQLLNNHLVQMSKYQSFKDNKNEFTNFIKEVDQNIVHSAVVARVRNKDFEGAYQLYLKMNKNEKPKAAELDSWGKEAELDASSKRLYDRWKPGH